LRLRAVMGRPNPSLPAAGADVTIPGMGPGAVLRFGVFELDPGQGELRRAGRRVPLQQQPLRALVLLATRPGLVVTREELRAALWPDGTHVDFDRGINFCMNQVRTALRDPARASHLVETVPRLGYRFLADVRVVPAEAAVAPGALVVPAATAAARRPRPWLAVGCALALAATIGGGTDRRPADAAPADPEARQHYLRGLLLLQRQDGASWEEAARAFEKATLEEPTSAAAQAALARALVGLSQAGLRPAAETLPRARNAALAALREDRRLADAWVSLSLVRLHLDWDWLAVEDIDRALALDPDLARAHRARAAYLSARGDHAGALAAARRAAALDPLCPTLRGDLGWYYYCARRFPEAAEEWRLSVAVQGDGGPRDRLVDAFRHLGRAGDAWREAETTMRQAGISGPDIADLARRGPEGALRGFLSGSADYLSRRGAPLVRLAALHAAAGEEEQAVALLERAAGERSWGLLGTLGVDPDFESLEGLPRYRRLLRETGLRGAERAAAPAAAILTE
jgi:DNA-binding winged helix-turn-helix (wHTH) protein/tetratricopeptide (TPR) repeat protein